jgi:LysR family transcriptional regulator of abg operon
MTIQQLRDLMAVLSYGGFRRAARALSISQAGLTKSIARLEEECGFGLIARTTKGIVLTPHGARFMPFANAVLAECERAQEWVREECSHRVRSLAVGVSIEPSLRLSPSVLQDFRRVAPDVTVHLTQNSTSELLAALRDGRLEFALMRLPDSSSLAEMRVEVLYEASAVIMARIGHPLSRARTVRELQNAQWLIVGDPSRPGSDDASMRELFHERKIKNPRIAAVTDSLFFAIATLAQTDCLARLPRKLLEHPLAARLLSEIPIIEQATHEVGLVYRSNRRLGKDAQLLSSMLKSFVRATQALERKESKLRKRD